STRRSCRAASATSSARRGSEQTMPTFDWYENPPPSGTSDDRRIVSPEEARAAYNRDQLGMFATPPAGESYAQPQVRYASFNIEDRRADEPLARAPSMPPWFADPRFSNLQWLQRGVNALSSRPFEDPDFYDPLLHWKLLQFQ